MLCRTGVQHLWPFLLVLETYFLFHNSFNLCSTQDTEDSNAIVDFTPLIISTICFNSLFLTTIFILTTPPLSSVHETTPFPFPPTMPSSTTPFPLFFFFSLKLFNNSFPLLKDTPFNSILLNLSTLITTQLSLCVKPTLYI